MVGVGNTATDVKSRLSAVEGYTHLKRFFTMRKVLEGAAREIILKVREFCEAEMKNKGVLIPLNNVRARVAAMTGVSEQTVYRITKEGKIAASTSSKIVTPGKIRPHPKKYNVDNFDMGTIGQKIHQLYIVKKKLPTVNKLRLELQKEINFQGSNTTLRRILKEMGFRFKSDFNFLKWMKEKIEPILSKRSSVTDDATYHGNKALTMNSSKSDMKDWLKQKGLYYVESWTKPVLYDIIKKNIEEPVSATVEYLEEHHEEAVKLSSCHSDLHPMEKISNLIKKNIAVESFTQEKKQICDSTATDFASIPPYDCLEVEYLEDSYFKDESIDVEMDRIYNSTEQDSNADTVDTSDKEDSDSDCKMSHTKPSSDHSYCKS